MAQQDVFYRDIMETSHATTWDAVFQAVDRILRFFQAVRARFVERDLVLEQLMYAMMLREHMMIDGPTGAAKSMMIDAAFSHIIGAVVWAMDLTRFTTDVQLFGSYDVREMRRSGKSLHLTEGSIAEANFAQTGEFFDANDPALRSLLGVLNERRVRKGPQFIQVPLLTAIADTNLHPEDLPEPRRNALDAVIDRFLFRTPVDYVVEPANRVTMIQVSLDRGRTAPIPELTLDDIVLVSGVVQEMNLVTDPYVIEAYQDMTLRYAQARKQAGGKWVPDRRTVRGAQIMEVSALMHGRTSVTFEDLEITRHVLAHNGDDTTMLEKARTEALETWIKRSHRREIEADRQKLKEVTKKAQIPTDLTTVDSEQLKTMHTQVLQVATELRMLSFSSIEVGREQIEAIKRVYSDADRITLRMLTLIASRLPTVDDAIPVTELTQAIGVVNEAIEVIRQIDPRSNEASVKHADLLERALADRDRLTTLFSKQRPTQTAGGAS